MLTCFSTIFLKLHVLDKIRFNDKELINRVELQWEAHKAVFFVLLLFFFYSWGSARRFSCAGMLWKSFWQCETKVMLMLGVGS